MSTIFDYVTAPEMAAYITKETSNSIPYLGETLFPSKKQVGTNISWLTGADGLPIAIQPSNFDAKATLRERTAFGKMETEMAFFREAMRIGEKDRQEINKLLNHPNSTIALPIVKNIFDDVKKLVDGVNAQAEIMRMELLQGGTITVKGVNNGASYKYDYKMASAHIKAVANKWDVPATSDPINDIMEMQNLIEEETGIRPTRCIMNRQTFLQMIKSESLRKLMYPNVTSAMISKIIVTETQVKTYVEETLNIKLVVYSKKVAQLGKDGLQGATVQLIKDGNVVLLPEGNIGYTWYGTTPEESDLLAGGTDAQVSLIKNATAITTYKEKHPVNVMTIVSSVMIPSFEAINNVAVLKVLS